MSSTFRGAALPAAFSLSPQVNQRGVWQGRIDSGVFIICALLASASSWFSQNPSEKQENPFGPFSVKFSDVKWQKIFPSWSAGTREIAILRVDAVTKATQLMIRVPKNFRVPQHWHSTNESHTVLSGTFVVECEGRKEELGPGSYSSMPAKMVHQGWTKPDEGAVLFITVDTTWDLNWVDGPPQPPAPN